MKTPLKYTTETRDLIPRSPTIIGKITKDFLMIFLKVIHFPTTLALPTAVDVSYIEL